MSCMMTNDREIATLAEYVAAILSQAVALIISKIGG